MEAKLEPGVHTEKGVHFGTTAAEIRRDYANRIEKTSNGTGESDYMLIVREPADPNRGVAFYIENEHVTWLLAGEYSALLLAEDCL